MDKNNYLNIANGFLSLFLSQHLDLAQLFSCDSSCKEILTFYESNAKLIYDTVLTILHEEANQNSIVAYALEQITESLRDGLFVINTRYFSSLQRNALLSTLIYKLTKSDYETATFSFDNWQSRKANHNFWYRGQSNYEWSLIPSFYRNLNNVYKNETRISLNTIKDHYAENGLAQKWLDVFNTNVIEYDFLAYMQHSISYSPFLDFTSDFPTALSFSLGNKSSINEYHYKDAAVFQIEVKDSKLNQFDRGLPPDFYINYLPYSYIIGTPIMGEPVANFDEIISKLRPSFCLYDISTNDRMKYQNGKFLFFYNYFSIKGNVCSWLNP